VVADRNRGAAFPAIGTASAGLSASSVPDLLPAEHEGPDRARDRAPVSAAELLDRADRGDRPRVLPRTGPRRLVTADIAAAALGMGC
jgi:hypothetical protein